MSAAQIVTRDYSAAIGTTPVQVVPGFGPGVTFVFYRLWNVAPTGGGTIWLSRTGTPGVNAPGSFPLAPGQFELFVSPQVVPSNPVWAVATAAGTPLTVELG